MPEISVFYGLRITLNFIGDEHNPPHIHVEYGSYEAIYSIRDYELKKGKMTTTGNKLVKKWLKIYQTELLEMWEDNSKIRRLPGLE